MTLDLLDLFLLLLSISTRLVLVLYRVDQRAKESARLLDE